jgi:prepilin-type N-terminal cleavage/methylation domain-containing protein
MRWLPPGCSAVRRRGLTLVELVVVMAILVALAGIVIPLLPGLIGRAETSARATNHSEIFKWIQTYEATTSGYPYDFDSLIDQKLGTLASYVANSKTTPQFQMANLTANQVSALTGAGITSLQYMSNTTDTTLPLTGQTGYYHNTFNPYPSADRSADRFTPTTSIQVVTLTNEGQRQLGLADNATLSTGVYVVVGLGRRCSLVGTGIADAPTNFFDNFKLDPTQTGSYSRYGVVFQVNGNAALNTGPVTATTTLTDFSRAKLVRVFRFGSSGLGSGDDAIGSYWNDVTGAGGS